jgi:hypothetical protein
VLRGKLPFCVRWLCTFQYSNYQPGNKLT